MSTQITVLKSWSHLLFWLSVSLPLLGVIAGVARYYVDRKERALSSAATKAELERSQSEIRDLRLQTAPRHLTAEQKAAIGQSLIQLKPSGVTFVSRLMDGESADFAAEIGEEFRRNKWTVNYNKSSLNEFQGLALALVGDGNFAGDEAVVTHALVAAGLKISKQEIRPGSVPGLKQPGVAVFVGRR